MTDLNQTPPPECSSSKRNAPVSAPTTIGGYTLAIAKALEYSGVDSTRVLKSVGISPVMTNDPMTRLPFTTLTRLFRACSEVTHSPYFGLTVAKFVQTSNLHALGYALAASANLMEFCRRIERYFKLVSQAVEIKLIDVGNEVEVHARMLVDVCAETEDAFLGFLVLSMRHQYDADFNPVRVAVVHAMPREGDGPYNALFRCPVDFSQMEPVLVLSKAVDDIHCTAPNGRFHPNCSHPSPHRVQPETASSGATRALAKAQSTDSFELRLSSRYESACTAPDKTAFAWTLICPLTIGHCDQFVGLCASRAASP